MITIRKNSDSKTISKTLTDANNIIIDTESVDRNESSRITRIALFWNKTDLTLDIKKPEAYGRQNLSVEANAEGVNYYNDDILKEYYTLWINDDCGTETAIMSYINTVLYNKLVRMRDASAHHIASLETKDSDLLVGQFVQNTTDAFNNTDGTNYTAETFQVVKRDKKSENKFEYTFERINGIPAVSISASPTVIGGVIVPGSPGSVYIPPTAYANPQLTPSTNITYANVPSIVKLGNIQSGNFLEAVKIIVTTAFGADNTVYISDSSGNIFGVGLSDLTKIGTYELPVNKKYAADSGLTATFAGTASTGAAIILPIIIKI